MDVPPGASSHSRLRRTSRVGVLVGIVTLLACELPWILTFVGLGAFATFAEMAQPPSWAEAIAALVFAAAASILLALFVRRLFMRFMVQGQEGKK